MSSLINTAYMPQPSTAHLPHDLSANMRQSAAMEPIDYLIQRVAERLIAVGKSERQASLDATGSPDALRYIRTRRAMPSPPRLRAIAEELNTSEDYLLGRTGKSAPPHRPLTAGDLLGDPDLIAKEIVRKQDEWSEKNQRLRARHIELPEDVPVFSADVKFNVSGIPEDDEWWISEGMSIMLGVSIDSFKRLPKLFNSENVYGFYMPGISMRPIFEAGSPVLVDGKRNPSPGDFALVYISEDPESVPHFTYTCMLKRLVRSTADWHEFEDFTPQRRFKVQRGQVDYMHRVFTLQDFLR